MCHLDWTKGCPDGWALLKNKITQLELENERLLKQLQEINVWSKKLYSKQSLL